MSVVRRGSYLLAGPPDRQAGRQPRHAARRQPRASDTIRALLGEVDTPTTPTQIAWAVRKLFEAVADRPLVVLLEDVHWGEPPLHDLLEHITRLARTAPILLLGLARPEVFEVWPALSQGALETTTVVLEPLSTGDTEELVARLAGATELEPGLSAKITAASAGNPLFVEEMLAMLRESGDRDVTVPPTIKALLAARLDQLPVIERTVLERGAIEGELFHASTVEALSTVPSRIEHLLAVLERKQLIHADRSQLGTGDAYRFRHLLIRDAVYDILTKAERARLHERFATWLEERGADSHEPEELVGYHLEQARRYLLELAPLDDEARELGRRAAGHLGPAGRRAFARGDMRAASSLLHRTVDLLPLDSYQRFELLPELGEALMEIGEFERARELSRRCRRRRSRVGRPRARSRRTADSAARRPPFDRGLGWPGEWRSQRETDRWIPVLERRREVRTLAKAWRMVAFFHGTACEWQATADALERGIRCAQEAGDPRQVARLSSAYVMALSDGPTPAPKQSARAEETLRLALIDRQAEAARSPRLAPLYAMSGQLIRGRELIARSRSDPPRPRRRGPRLRGRRTHPPASTCWRATRRRPRRSSAPTTTR